MSQNDRDPFFSDKDYLGKLRHELVRDRSCTDWTAIPIPVIRDALASYEKDARIAALEARLAEEARVRGLYPYLCPECGGNWNGPELAAYDDRIRRETVERIAEAMVTSSHFPNMPTQDWFYRAAGITPHAGEKGEGG